MSPPQNLLIKSENFVIQQAEKKVCRLGKCLQAGLINNFLNKTKMPKVKTNSGAKKRFAFTGTGKIKRKHAYKSHILTKKTKKQKRNLTRTSIVDKANQDSVRMLLVMK
jgi:large subunit ribosomal protein L35